MDIRLRDGWRNGRNCRRVRINRCRCGQEVCVLGGQTSDPRAVHGPTGGAAGLEEMLASWLPRQRWFPGRGVAVSELSVVSDVTLSSGDPGLAHMVAQTPLHGDIARFQLLVGSRRELPRQLEPAVIGRSDGIAYYDALHDPQLAAALVGGIADELQAGPLSFVREGATAGAGDFWSAAGWHDGRVLTAEQSNTSLVFGNRAILKMLRRLFPGANPDLEVADALARLGSARVAAPFGWIQADFDGQPVLLGVLSQFLAGASEGWALALRNIGELYAGSGDTARDSSAGLSEPMPFAAEARLLGEATAELHADMARAFGTRAMTNGEQHAMASAMTDKLTAAAADVPELRTHEQRIRSAYDSLTELREPVTVQRIHGDYHLGQVLRGADGWVALDFEGEPGVPLAQRRAMAPALRDVAGMLRSFDYAARHQIVGHSNAAEVAKVADAWVGQCQAEFCAGYAAAGGADPDSNGQLLRALILEKAVYEVVYEHRHRPSWLPIPMDFVAAA